MADEELEATIKDRHFSRPGKGRVRVDIEASGDREDEFNELREAIREILE